MDKRIEKEFVDFSVEKVVESYEKMYSFTNPEHDVNFTISVSYSFSALVGAFVEKKGYKGEMILDILNDRENFVAKIVTGIDKIKKEKISSQLNWFQFRLVGISLKFRLFL